MVTAAPATIRELKQIELPEVAAMVRTVLNETWRNPATLDQVITANGSIDAWQRYLDTRHCLVASQDGEIVGAAWVFIADATAHVGGAFVRNRGQGIGRQLLNARLDYAIKRECRLAHATVVIGNEASRRNLEGAGFALSGDDGVEWTFTKALRPTSCGDAR